LPETPPVPARAAVLVSGGGSNLEALLKARRAGELAGVEVVLVISSRAGAGALEHARIYGVSGVVLERAACPTEEAF